MCGVRTGLFSLKVSSVAVLFTTTSLFASPEQANATTAAGRTPGTFKLSPTGAATYTIPILAPPGPQGLQPKIALVYNSQHGNGPLGVGWGIGGLGSIHRCNLTYAQDAAPSPVTLTTSDGLCLDGKRLRLTSGTYGAAGSTYQTEIADFSNVTANGAAGNGPAYFTVQGRDGRTYTYGDTTDSRVLATGTSTALSWQLNEVSDRAGNTMTIAYTAANGTAVPSTISWTPSSHGSSTYNYTMTFAYGTNVPQSSIYAYAAGTSVQNTSLLTSITIAYTGTTVKKYVLTYQLSPTTSRDELISVQECADSAQTNCLLPTTITYQNGAKGVSTSSTTAVSTASGSVLAHYDLNGDGYPDLIYKNGSYWYVAFGSATGFGTPVSTGISSTLTVLAGDLLANGKDGLLANHSGTWYYYTWNGSSFTGTSTGLAYDSAGTQFLIADINGDGRPDLIELVVTVQAGYAIYTRLNTSSTSSVSFSATRVTALSASDTELADASIASGSDGATIFGTLRQLDFNGDGREDIVLHLHDHVANTGSIQPLIDVHTLSELLSNGSTFTRFQINGASFSTTAFVNWNSDACTDYMTGATIFISGCNGSVPSTLSLGSATVIGAMDWDGDGRTDILVANGSTVGVYLSTGTGAGSLVTTSVPYSASNTYFTFEPAGDGLDALGYYPASGAIAYYKHNGAGQAADLVSSVTDGFGNSVSPTYLSLVQANYTEYTDAVYPYKNYIGPMYVVNEAVFSDPSSSSGGTYNQTFGYFGAWTNVQGRGWQAFYAVRLIDSRNSLQYLDYYERSFPYTGMVFEHRIYNGNANDPSQTDNTLAPLVTLSSTQYQQRYFAYFSNSTTYTAEVGGTENGDLITTASTNYTLDNYGNATTIATTVTDNDPSSPYTSMSWTTTTTNTPDVDTTHWCLTLFTETQVAYSSTLSGSNSVTRTKTFTPDTTNCRYTQIITEPNSSQFKVTEALSYDSFGNVDSDTITGINMTARVTSTNWGTTGQFINTLTDPTSALTTWIYSTTQSLGFGVPDSIKDANNLTTSWQYDAFGRKTQETRPDATYTVWTYQNCSGTTGCLVGNNGLVVGHTVHNTDNSYQSSGTNYLDSVDRLLVANQVQLSGYSRSEARYDSLGRIVQRAFPCTWSSLATTCTYWMTNSYDVLNRLSQSQRPISSTNSNLQSTSLAYAGRTTTMTDPLSNSETTVTDVNGWLRQTKDAYGYTVTLAYDAAGSKTGASDSLGNTLWSGTYNYGLAPFLATGTDMDRGAWSYTDDAIGERIAWRDAKGQSFSKTYDALSRPLTRTEADYFTQWTWGSSASSHNIGKLQSVCTGLGNNPTNCTASPGYTESETYDSIGRLSQRLIDIPGQSGAFTYTWAYNTTTGLLNTLMYPNSYPSTYSLQVQYAYSNGILQSVTDVSDTPNVTVWTANTMNSMGQITQETLGNGIVTNRSYDAVTSWLGSAQSGIGGGSAVKNLSVLYDEMGDVTQRQDNNLGLTENIYYDNDYRFSYSKLNGTQNLSITYDGTGNITSRSDVAGGASWTYSSTQKHAVTQAGSSAFQYSYDANGNALTRQGNSLTWASYNYPISISAGSGSTAETVGFAYGPDRQRWQQSYTGNGTTETTDYIGKFMDFVSTGGVLDYRHYIYAGNTPVAVYSRKSTGVNTFSYMLADHQGSVASITNSSGAVVVGESFTAFGSRRNPTTWSGAASNSDLTTAAGISRQGYTFQTQLGLWMGMNHMKGRVQDAITGRFLSANPRIPNKADTQSYNRYSYVNNNPLSLVDPSGFDGCAANAYCADYGNYTVTTINGVTFQYVANSGYTFDSSIVNSYASQPLGSSNYAPGTQNVPYVFEGVAAAIVPQNQVAGTAFGFGQYDLNVNTGIVGRTLSSGNYPPQPSLPPIEGPIYQASPVELPNTVPDIPDPSTNPAPGKATPGGAPQQTPSQETPSQETPSQETPSQETPSPDTDASGTGSSGGGVAMPSVEGGVDDPD